VNLEIKLNPDFQGPTLLELEPVIAETQGQIEVRWENSKAEVALLYENSNRFFLLHVKDISTLERTASAFGTSFAVDPTILESARLSFVSRKAAQNWDHINSQYGQNVSRSILTRLLADSIRKGKDPRVAAPVAQEVLLDQVNPLDASVLFRIREIRGY
jgi:hypothetical protein